MFAEIMVADSKNVCFSKTCRWFRLTVKTISRYSIDGDWPAVRTKGTKGDCRKMWGEKCGAKYFRTLLSLTIFRPTFFDRKHCSLLRTSFFGPSCLKVRCPRFKRQKHLELDLPFLIDGVDDMVAIVNSGMLNRLRFSHP